MPQTFTLRQFRKSPRRHSRQVLSWPPCQPTPTRCPFFHSETPAPTASTIPGPFVAWNSGVLDSGPQAFLREHVAVANAAGQHLDAHLSRIRLRDFALDDLKVC